MKLDEVGQIKKSYDEKEVNKYLAEGFVLIKCISEKVPINDFSDMAIKTAYTLGLKR